MRQANSTRPRRVLFPFVGDSVGGSHLATLTLIENLDRTRVEPTITVDRDGPLASLLRSRRLAYRQDSVGFFAGETPGAARSVFFAAAAMPRILPVIRSAAIDLVHTNDLRCHLTWAPAARLSGAHWVWHIHQLLSASLSWNALAALASANIAVSPEAAATVPKSARGGVSVVPNPFDFLEPPDRAAARGALATELGIPVDRPIVAYVGNMTTQKRPSVFAEAAIRIRQRASVAPYFILVGDDRGGERARVETIFAEAGMSNAVRFMGFRHPVEQTLAGADILLAPGVGDSFGRTLVEALSVGTPVVGSRSGGHAFIVVEGETGTLVPPDDPEAAAQAVLRLLDDHGLAEALARAGGRDVRSRFGAAGIAGIVADLYERLMRR